MARFYGAVGYGVPTEVDAGVWEDTVIERNYFGSVERAMKQFGSEEKVLPDLRMNHQVSIVADAFALENFSAIKYVELAGTKWIVTNVEIRRPRLVLQVGQVYNGPGPKP